MPLDDGADSQNYIHEISVKGAREGLPTLVLIHGYMSGGVQFCKLMGHLRNHFNLLAIDLVGFGSSGRPQGVLFTDFESSLDFFLTRIYEVIIIYKYVVY